MRRKCPNRTFQWQRPWGWVCVVDSLGDVPAGEVFTVRDGNIRIAGQPIGYMRTARQYGDYRLHAEWRWIGEATNSGIFQRVQEGDKVWPQGIECQLMAGRAGGLVLLSFLLILARIDARTQLLPDRLTLPLLWAGLLFNLNEVYIALPDAVAGAMAGYLALWSVYWLFRLLTGKEALGYGDFKLLAALGAWCGWQVLPQVLLLASASGLVWTLLQRLWTRQSLQQPLAFGPWLALAGGGIFLWQQMV